MARASRRTQIAELNTNGFISQEIVTKVYNTAIYARLSVEDTRPGKSGDTLNTQIYFIKKYLEDKPYLNHILTFSDNGFSGTSFDRPGFEALMDAVRNGEVNCIVVKDFSRFGRNYIETGSYIENVFPFMGVRFISINDDYDSDNPADRNNHFSKSIKHLCNEQVARDISKKVNSTFKTKRENGEFIGTYAPHGYLKSPEDKHKLIIDPETAPVILRIFEMRASGMTYGGIADTLNIEGIESPVAYRIRKGISREKLPQNGGIWIPTHIRNILRNQVYIGNMVQGKTACSKFNGNKVIYRDESDWIIVKNTHEAIIPMDLWDKIVEIFEQTQAAYDMNNGKFAKKYKPSENWLKGKMFCGDCGYAINRAPKYYADGKRYYQYSCSHKDRYGKACPSKLMLEPKLYELMYKSIRTQMNLCVDYQAVVSKLERQERTIRLAESLNNERKKLIAEKSSKVKRKTLLYDDYVEQNISRDDYCLLSAKYDEEIEILTQKISEVESTIANKEVMLSKDNDWITAFDKFRRQRKLSKEMVDLLIKKVIFIDKDTIEIEFNFKDQYEELIRGIAELQKEVADYE